MRPSKLGMYVYTFDCKVLYILSSMTVILYDNRTDHRHCRTKLRDMGIVPISLSHPPWPTQTSHTCCAMLCCAVQWYACLLPMVSFWVNLGLGSCGLRFTSLAAFSWAAGDVSRGPLGLSRNVEHNVANPPRIKATKLANSVKMGFAVPQSALMNVAQVRTCLAPRLVMCSLAVTRV